jgi:putative ABC transport system permease protein
VEYVTPNLFSLLGAKPILGRIFLPTEAQDRAQAIDIRAEFWKHELNSDPQVLGRTFAIEGVVSTIVGVMQPHFAPFYGGCLDVWIPINAASSRYSGADRPLAHARGASKAWRDSYASSNRNGRGVGPTRAGVSGDE